MIRVLVCDDHPMVHAGLGELIGAAPDLELAGSARDGAEAVELCARLEPDVVLMDLVMPGLDGVEATRRITAQRTGCHVLVLTAFSDPDRILAALSAGAVGYLVKDMPAHELLGAVRAAHRGQGALGPTAATEIVAGVTSRARRLTPRERQILALLAEGLPNGVIARRLGISVGTVKTNLTSIYRRLGVDNRTTAALWAQLHRRELAPDDSHDD